MTRASVPARWIIIALVVALSAGAALWRLTRTEPAPPVTVTQGEVRLLVSGPGTVQARVPVTVSTRVGAQVIALHADHGDLVKRGQLLAILDDRDLAAKRSGAAAAGQTVKRNIQAAQASLAKAQADLELARNRQQRDLELHRAGFISQSAYDVSSLGLRAAQASVDNAAALHQARKSESGSVAADARYTETLWSHTRISAPMDGLVIQRSAEVGSTVAPGATIFRLVDPATLWVAARIDEALVSKVEEGMPATIRLRNGQEHPGRVARISRQSDAATRELEVDVAFDVPPARFAIDQEAEVSIAVGVERGLAVPVAALVYREGHKGVYVVRDGRKVFQILRISASDGTVAIVADGLDQEAKLAAWTSR